MVSSTTEVASTFPPLAYANRDHKYAIVNGSGVTELVPAVVGMKIRLLAGLFVGSDMVAPPVLNIQTKPAGTAVSLTGEMSAQQNINIVFPFSPAGWLETASGEKLQMTTTGTFTGCIVYDEVAG